MRECTVEMFEPAPVSRPKEARYYQMEAVSGIQRALLEGHKRIALVLPTGSGKTLTAALFFSHPGTRKLFNVPGNKKIRVLYAAHLDALLQQAIREFQSFPEVELIPQSIYSRIPDHVINNGWDVVCIDECHHEAMRTYQDKLEILGETPIIGLTATPDRDDGMLIKFSAIVESLTRVKAVREGYLADSIINTIIDESGPDKSEILGEIFNTFIKEMGKTLVFVKTHHEANLINELLRGMGYASVALTTQPKKFINQVLDQFSEGEYQFIVNCSKIDEGVDVKGCTDVVLGRNFNSRRQLNQTIGRAARPDSPCTVWELVDPLKTRVTAIDIIKEAKEQRLIFWDYDRKQWLREKTGS